MSLYLVRHGRTAWNLAGKAQGWTDEPLDELGVSQAERLPKAFAGIHATRIVTSDLVRAISTGLPLAKALAIVPEVDVRLRERGFGDWEGAHFTDIGMRMRAAAGDGDPDLVRPPNGESYADLWSRVAPVAAALTEGTVFVAHGGTLSCLLPMLLGGTLSIRHAFSFANAGVTELRVLPDGRWRLARFDVTAHLEGL